MNKVHNTRPTIGFRKISHRILAVSVLSISACLGLTGWFTLRIGRDIAIRKIAEADLQLVRRIAEVTDTRMAAVESAFHLAAVLLDNRLGEPKELADGIAGLMEGFTEIASVYVADANGNQLFRSDRLPLENVANILSFQIARKGEEIASDVYPEQLNARPVRTFTMPIRRGDRVVGVLSADITFGGLAESVASTPMDGDSQLYVVSGNGRVFAHTALDKLKSLDLSGMPPVESVLSGAEGTLDGYSDEFGRKVLGTYTPIPSLGWGVVVQKPLEDIAAEISRLQAVVLASVFASAVFAVLMGWLVSRRIAKPIVFLAKASEKVAGGDLTQSVELRDTDEIGVLSHSFNEMVRSLRSSHDELRSLNSSLESQVAQRTVELEKRGWELTEALEAAKSADRLKSAFLATMSHELRTPLNSIIGFTGILQQQLAGPLNAEQAKQMGMIRNSARHLLSLINDVLDISKIEAGQLEIVKQPFDMRESIETTLRAVAPMAEKSGLQLTVAIGSGVGTIVSDKRRVEQILMNLLSNAIKFTERGEVGIECRMEGRDLVTCVRDTGRGIREEDLPKLFTPFRQIDTGITRQFEGTGLGLSICRNLVGLLSGTIRVESEWGKGSAFTFTLPSGKESG